MQLPDICFIGRARTGKTTAATLLKSDWHYYEMAFGDKLKSVARDLYPDEMISGKNRELLQWLGQTLRERDINVWVNYVVREYRLLNNLVTTPVVVSDCRQENEYLALKELGFTFVKIEADLDVRLDRMREEGDNFKPEQLHHQTEEVVDQLPYDFLIKNNGNFEDFRNELNAIVRGGLVNGRSIG